MKRVLKHFFLFILLTLLTQVGGIVYILNLIVLHKLKLNFKFKKITSFLVLYILFTFIIVPITAPLFGREPIIHSKKIQPVNYFTVIFNRNYVKPKINSLLLNVEKELAHTNIHINYLDANFPFINAFPLLPHLSHNDGKKLDISFVYEDSKGVISSKQKSFSGYGVFEKPTKNELNQTEYCKAKGYIQYDFTKYLKLGHINKHLKFSKKGTKKLVKAIIDNQNIEKVFIEPHIKQRLQINSSKIRYHGCKAVRHDDHIHIQMK
ncbi:hypothetical protein [Pseudofulvibacter geojedonensis]|uniref:Uncharacterized protein n=1 Tax=Pseudofulvibacter geojedonensis TaxID=1123758 RepID=A0ABW3HYV7_9FLAO